MPPSATPHTPVLEEVIAWRAAMMGWVWTCFCLAGGLARGLLSGQEGLNNTPPSIVPLSSPLFLAFFFAMGMMLSGVWTRLRQVAKLGYLNFTVSRLGWLIVATVFGAALWAGPSGAFRVILSSLTNMPEETEAVRGLVMGRLVLGQGWVVLAALPWLAYVVAAITRLHVKAPLVPAALLWCMLLCSGVGLALGAEAIGMLFGLSVGR